MGSTSINLLSYEGFQLSCKNPVFNECTRKITLSFRKCLSSFQNFTSQKLHYHSWSKGVVKSHKWSYQMQYSRSHMNGRQTPQVSHENSKIVVKDEIKDQQESFLLRAAVELSTEFLRILGIGAKLPANKYTEVDMGVPLVMEDSMLSMIRADYEERAYFLTGNITEKIYDEECFFGDPTVSFTGRDKWKRNISLLVPFFIEPSIELKSIEEIENDGIGMIVTQWRLRTYLNFPWKPLIDVNGSTIHTMDSSRLKVVRHVESWEVSGLEAIGQLFVPSKRIF